MAADIRRGFSTTAVNPAPPSPPAPIITKVADYTISEALGGTPGPFDAPIGVDKTQPAEKLLIPLGDQEETSIAGMKKALDQVILSARVEKHKFIARNGSPPELHRSVVVLEERRGDFRPLDRLDLGQPDRVRKLLTVCERVIKHWRDSQGKPEALSPFGFYFVQSVDQVRYLPASVCRADWPESVAPFVNEAARESKKRLSESELCDNLCRTLFLLVHGEVLPPKEVLNTINRIPDRHLREAWKRLLTAEVGGIDEALKILNSALVHDQNPPRQELLPATLPPPHRLLPRWTWVAALAVIAGVLAVVGYQWGLPGRKALADLVKRVGLGSNPRSNGDGDRPNTKGAQTSDASSGPNSAAAKDKPSYAKIEEQEVVIFTSKDPSKPWDSG